MALALCPTREELQDYIRGKMPDEASDLLAEHLDGCPQCQAELAGLSDVDDTLIGQLQNPETSDPYVVEPKYQEALVRAKSLFADCGAGGGISPDGSTTFLNQQLGEYLLIERLGRGGMGTVYKARQRRLDRVVALKILSRGRTGDAHAVVRFEREMKAIGRLDHPNIVKAYDAREIDGTLVLIMEFIDGLDLSDIARRIGPLPMADACEMVRRTAIALQYAHEHGLVHRDIKPSNIMLSRSGEVKLLDLGLARFFAEVVATDVNNAPNDHSSSPGEEMTASGQAMGTADYMAPEQASDSRSVDIRADIYSLGCTLYKLLSGRPPFGGPEYRGTLDKMNAHVHETPPPIRQFVPELPDELVAILDRMLAKNPADRFATPAEVAAALEKVAESSSLSNAGQIKNLSYEANLPALIDRAISLPREQWAKAEKSQDANFITPRPASSPIRRRPIVKYLLLGLAIFGLLGLAFAAGILITIKRAGKPDSTIEAPDGSKVNVSEQGDVKIDLPPGEDKDYVMVDLSAKDAKATLPPEPYKIGIGDYLCIRASFAIPDYPVDGIYRVEPTGTVPLSPVYGRVKVDGLSLVEAEKTIANKLNDVLRNPEISVTLAGWKKRSANMPPPQPHKIAPGDILSIWASYSIPDQPINGPYLVESDGQITLGPAYGRVNVKGLTFENAEKLVKEKLSETLRNPEVSITLGGWRKLLKTPVLENPRERKKAEGEQKTQQPPPSEAQIKVFSLHNGDAATLMQEVEMILPTNDIPGLAKAMGKEKVDHPLRLSVDARTNSIIASGDAEALAIVESILKRMDETPTKAGLLKADTPQTNNKSEKTDGKQEDIPLAQAINDFNAKYRSQLKNRRPLTVEEVLKGVEKFIADRSPNAAAAGGSPSGRLGKNTLSETEVLSLKSILENRKLPKNSDLTWSQIQESFMVGRFCVVLRIPREGRSDDILVREEFSDLRTGKTYDNSESLFHAREMKPITFQTAKITRGDITATIHATGTIEPEEVVDVSALVSGKIEKLFVDYNSPVEKDQILAKIDDAEYKSRLDNELAGLEGAKAKLRQAEAKAALAKSELQIAQDTNKKVAGSISHSDLNKLAVDFEVAQAAVAEAMANVKQSENAVQTAQKNLAFTEIKSPIKGIVIARRVNVGQNIADEKKSSLFLIAKDSNAMKVWALVNEADIGRIHEGMDASFTVDAFPNKIVKGKVTQIRQNAQQTQNVVLYTVVVTFDNSEAKLMPYMTANVRFEIESRKNVLLVSNRALMWSPKPEMLPEGWKAENFPDYVPLWTKSADGKHVEPVLVKLGISDGKQTAVIGPEDLEGKEIITGIDESVKPGENPFKPGERKQTSQPQAAVNPAAELKALQGEWKVVRQENGDAADTLWLNYIHAGKLSRLLFHQEHLSLVNFDDDDYSDYLKFRIDPTASPKTITILEQGSEGGMTLGGMGGMGTDTSFSGQLLGGKLAALGIYQFEGQQLKICLAKFQPSLMSDQRPKSFALNPQSGDTLLALERYQPSEDEKKMLGQWKVVRQIDGGKPLPEENLRNRFCNFHDYFFSLYSNSGTGGGMGGMGGGMGDPMGQGIANYFNAPFLLDETKNPKTITIHASEKTTPLGPVEKLKLNGIFAFKDDGLTIAYRKNAPAPDKFESAEGSDVTLLELKRSDEKPAADAALKPHELDVKKDDSEPPKMPESSELQKR